MAGTWSRAVFALTVVVAVASVPISWGHEGLYDTVLYPLNAVVLGTAGLLIVRHQQRHPIGWVLIGTGCAAAWVELTEGYGYYPAWPGARTVEWVSNWGSFVGIGMTAVVVALFPTGRRLSRSRRALVAAGVVSTVLQTVGAAFSHSSDATFASGRNPYAADGLTWITTLGQVLFTATLLASIAAIIVRFRRANGIERQQLKWIAYALALLAVVAPFAIFWYDDSGLVRVAIAVVVTAWPIAVCVAILRYRLYDIDVLISRTVVYALLTVLLTGTYVVIVVGLGTAIGQRGSSLLTAVATLAVAVAFRPLRGWLQDAVDRRFRRARHAALTRVDRFLDDLRAGRADPATLTPLLRELTGWPDLEVSFLRAGQSEPTPSDLPPGWATQVVRRGPTPLAVVRHPTGDEAAVILLDEVLARAGLAFEIARLQAEVHHQLAEVEASRARIVTAGHEERRRIERDLHDGAQQRLVSIGLALRHAQYELGASPVADTIDAAVVQLSDAITDLRELANGVRPALLGSGLDVALRELAGRTPLPIDVHAGPERYPSDVEATAYFVACEALTNAVKHAHASRVELRTDRAGDRLVVTVRDDGVGGADTSLGRGTGTGLRGLSDRVAAHGGRIRLHSTPGVGTTLVAELPCAS